MTKKFIKNMDHETVLNLAEQVKMLPGQVVSKTLAQNKAVSVTLFAFDRGEEIGTHDSEGDAMVTMLEGKGRFTVDGKAHYVGAGEVLVLPAKKPHAVYAPEPFNMLRVVGCPPQEGGVTRVQRGGAAKNRPSGSLFIQ
jgi:quercetin dioxygenase-like cupin family protein